MAARDIRRVPIACVIALSSLACGHDPAAAPPMTAEMIAIPSAELSMGCSSARDPSCAPTEQPVHRVTVEGFRIDRDEVTSAAYASCVAARGCTAAAGASAVERADRPIGNVTWSQARAFCAWRGARLPSEAEWELAARGTDGRIYPWGDDEPNCERAWTATCGTEPADVGARPLGSSPFGVRDMAGNVDEWVEDEYAAYGGGAPSGERVARGGAYDVWHARSTARNALRPDYHDALLGFRCASDL